MDRSFAFITLLIILSIHLVIQLCCARDIDDFNQQSDSIENQREDVDCTTTNQCWSEPHDFPLTPPISREANLPFIRPQKQLSEGTIIKFSDKSHFQLVRRIQFLSPYDLSDDSEFLNEEDSSSSVHPSHICYVSGEDTFVSTLVTYSTPPKFQSPIVPSLLSYEEEKISWPPYTVEDLEHLLLHPNISLHLSMLNPYYFRADPNESIVDNEIVRRLGRSKQTDYVLHEKVGVGHYGEIWLARQALKASASSFGQSSWEANANEHEQLFVLKRLFTERGIAVRESGMREVYFGRLLQKQSHIARFVEYFEIPKDNELWLVFHHEGISLAGYLKTERMDGLETYSDEWKMLRLNSLTEEETLNWMDQTVHDNEEAPVEENLSNNAISTDCVSTNKEKLRTFAKKSTTFFLQKSTLKTNDNLADGTLSPSINSSKNATGELLRDLLFQLLSSLEETHQQGTTHRDIKPANVLLKLNRFHPHHRFMQPFPGLFMPKHEHFEHQFSRKQCSSETFPWGHKESTIELRFRSDHPMCDLDPMKSLGHVRLCDYGSALSASEDTNQRLYATAPPSALQSTLDYAPPELHFLSTSEIEPFTSYRHLFTPTYDMWSFGVLILEIILGSRERVFAINSRTRAMITQRLGQHATPETIEKAVFLRALTDWCIYEPSSPHRDQQPFRTSSSQSSALAFSETCSDAVFESLLKQHDPLHIGVGETVQSRLLVRFIRELLRWDPSNRLTSAEALQHAYFHGDYYECKLCGSKMEFYYEYTMHMQDIHSSSLNAR